MQFSRMPDNLSNKTPGGFTGVTPAVSLPFSGAPDPNPAAALYVVTPDPDTKTRVNRLPDAPPPARSAIG